MRSYTGIGARETPPDVLVNMRKLGKFLGSTTFTLRSGGARGADVAFEAGCTSVGGKKEIYLPYPHFNGSTSDMYHITPQARAIAKEYHPNWPNLGDAGRAFMSRNSYQMLGLQLDDPTEFVVCWTQGGKIIHGTGQALRIAKDLNIPVYNFAVMSLNEISDAILKHVGD
jgi:hypothetical protein